MLAGKIVDVEKPQGYIKALSTLGSERIYIAEV
jgi:hypothetical protein